jgi:hypothetical protein
MVELLTGAGMLLVVAVCVVVILAVPALTSWVATQKGYKGGTWFALGFFLNVFALIAIAGAPDLTLLAEIKAMGKGARRDAESNPTLAPLASAGSAAAMAATPVRGSTWECKHCGTDNPATESCCKGCGKYR